MVMTDLFLVNFGELFLLSMKGVHDCLEFLLHGLVAALFVVLAHLKSKI